MLARSSSDVSAAIEAIYDTVVDPGAWPKAINAVRSLIGGDGGSVFLLDHDSGAIPFFARENLNPDADKEYETRLRHIDPRIEPSLADPPGVPCWDYRFLDDAEMDRHEFYDGIHRLAGVRYFVGVRPLVVDGGSLLTAIVRTKRQGHFDEHEIALYARIAPHLGHAFRLMTSVEESRRDATLSHLIDQRRTEAVFLLDAAGRLIQANVEASRVLALNDGLCLDDGWLQPWKASDRRRLNNLVAEAHLASSEAMPGGGVLALPRPSGALPYLLRVIPWPKGHEDPVGRPAVVVLLRDPERAVASRTEELTALLGLTEREAALAHRLARGESLQEGAASLQITHNTARVHLRNIFEKTGVTSQRDLVRLILSAP